MTVAAARACGAGAREDPVVVWRPGMWCWRRDALTLTVAAVNGYLKALTAATVKVNGYLKALTIEA